MRALNPTLYEALCRAFSPVRVANEGARFSGRIVPGLLPGHRPKVKIQSTGEYYCVNCFNCGDTRQRLWINHRWGTSLEGISLSHLAICYNESCEQERGFQRDLKERVASGRSEVVYQDTDANEDEGPRPVPLPGVCKPLTVIPPAHPSRKYILSRGFDPDVLSNDWGVSWCEYTTKLPPENRLIFPLHDWYEGQLVIMGWQARWLNTYTGSGDPTTKFDCKYFFAPGARPNMFLYNGYRAKEQRDIVVICEGVFDAMRVGTAHGVAVYGKTLSEQQKYLLWEQWGKHGAVGVVAFDPDASENTAKALEWLQGWKGKTFAITFDPGEDAGSASQNEIWAKIRAGIAAE